MISGVMQKLPDNHPLVIAWEAYRATEEYANSLQWAMQSHDKMTVEGSLWGAFVAGRESLAKYYSMQAEKGDSA